MESPLLLAPAEDSALHNLYGLVFSRERLKIIPLPLLPDQNREFFERQMLKNLFLTRENHE